MARRPKAQPAAAPPPPVAPENPEEALASAIGSFRHDPLGFVLFNYPWGVQGGPLANKVGPRDWQRRVLQDIGDRLKAGFEPGSAIRPVFKAIASGHGIGKTTLVAWICDWAMSTFPDTRGRVTANTQAQLLDITWAELKKWRGMAVNAHWFEVTATSMFSREPGHSESWCLDAVTWSKNNLEAFAGLHNEGKRILMVFDEASGIDSGVWDVAKGALTDADTEIVWLAPGNPTRPEGEFHKCFFGAERHLWAAEQIDSRTVEGTNKTLFAEWLEAHGEDSDFFRIRVRGQFPRTGENQFIGTEIVAASVKRAVNVNNFDPLIIGVDVARSETGDETVIAFRKGRDATMIPWVKMRTRDTYAIAVKVAELSRQYAADMVFVDGGGVGAGVVDALRQLRVRHIEVQFGGKADTADGAALGKWKNKRSEMWGLTKDWLKRGSIPQDDALIKDLSGPHFTLDLQGAIVLEPKEAMKKRGLASPDNADALALTFAGPVLAASFAGGPLGMMGSMAQRAPERDPWA